MKRGDLYRVFRATKADPRSHRVLLVVSRQAIIDSSFSTVCCVPVYSRDIGLATEVDVGPEFGMKKDCVLHCDEILSLPKYLLTDYIGALDRQKLREVDSALKVALAIED